MTVAPANIVGQPATALVTFLDATGTKYDPPTVVLSAVSPFGNATAYTYGTSPQVVKVDVGDYMLTFTPTVAGEWVVIGDAFDILANQIGAGISAVLDVGARMAGSQNVRDAIAVVEQYIKPWTLRVVTNDVVRLYALEDGVLELPGRPVISVSQVVDVASGQIWTPLPTLYGFRLMGADPNPSLIPYKWYDVTYTHGWTDATVPPIIATVIARVAARLAANPDGVMTEAIGPGYSVNYGQAASLDLLPDEKKALAQFRANRSGTLTSMDLTGSQTTGDVGP